MSKSALTENKEQSSPVLVIDKVGVIGEAVAKHFSKDYLVVLLSEKLFSRDSTNILHVPFKKKIPEVPDNEYAKIFIVDDGSSVTRESAFSFINKALENNAPLYFIGSIRNIDVEHADDITKSYKNAKVLLFGDLFDNALIFDKSSSINKFIYSIRNEKKIYVAGNGLALNFPITFIDTIKLIIKATQLDISQKIIMLFSGQPITDVSLANIFKKIKQNILIDFVKKEKIKKIYIPEGAMNALNKYDLGEKIKDLDLTTEKKEDKKIVNQKKKNKTPFIYPVIITLFFILLPFITTSFFIFLGKEFFSRAEDAISKGNIEVAKLSAGHSLFIFNISDKTSYVLSKELNLLRLENLSDEISKEIATGKYLSQATQEISIAALEFEAITKRETDSPRDEFYKASNNLKDGMDLVAKSESISKLPGKFKKIISDLTPASELLSSPETALNILGFDKGKKYLVVELDKNNNQPVGGGIERIRLVFIKNGGITNSKIIKPDDFGKYEENKVQTPFYAKRYDGIDSPSIPNSVYKIGFSQNVNDIISIYSSVNSQSVDGVLGVTSDYFSKLDQTTVYNFIKTVGRGIKEKNILFSSSNADIQKVLDAKNWAGSITDNRISEQGVVNDYFGIIESRVGNSQGMQGLDVSRTVSKNLVLNSKGIINSTINIALKNNGKTSRKTYMQFLIPNKSTLSEIKLNEISQKITPAITDPDVFTAKSFKAPLGLEVEQHSESGKHVVGFLIDIPSNSLKTITISYELPYIITSSQESFKYALNFYKQPGMSDYNVRIDFILPVKFKIINADKNFDIVLDQDKNISIAVSQK